MSVQIDNVGNAYTIGTRATVDKIGMWGTTPVVQPTNAAQAAIGTLEDVTNTASTNTNSAINNNFATIKTLVNRLRTDLVAIGIIKGS